MIEDITPQDISPKDIQDEFIVKYHFEDHDTNERNYKRTLVIEH